MGGSRPASTKRGTGNPNRKSAVSKALHVASLWGLLAWWEGAGPCPCAAKFLDGLASLRDRWRQTRRWHPNSYVDSMFCPAATRTL